MRTAIEMNYSIEAVGSGVYEIALNDKPETIEQKLAILNTVSLNERNEVLNEEEGLELLEEFNSTNIGRIRPLQGAPTHPQQSFKNLQCLSGSTASSMKRQGRGAVTREAAEREALRRMAALVRATEPETQWEYDYSPEDWLLLCKGDHALGLGTCIIEPEIWLLLWEALSYCTPRC